jgi:hypothetical protein
LGSEIEVFDYPSHFPEVVLNMLCLAGRNSETGWLDLNGDADLHDSSTQQLSKTAVLIELFVFTDFFSILLRGGEWS